MERTQFSLVLESLGEQDNKTAPGFCSRPWRDPVRVLSRTWEGFPLFVMFQSSGFSLVLGSLSRPGFSWSTPAWRVC